MCIYICTALDRGSGLQSARSCMYCTIRPNYVYIFRGKRVPDGRYYADRGGHNNNNNNITSEDLFRRRRRIL